MTVQIIHRYTRAVLYESQDATDLRAAVVHAVRSGADLRDADLRGADLRDADLRDAYLRGADLRDADLRDADLRDAYLRDADLGDADLGGADLGGAKGISVYRSTPLAMLYDQPGEIRAYKLVQSDGAGPYNGGLTYEVGGEYVVDDADTDPHRDCAPGINLATLDWCMQRWREGHRILVAEHTAADIAAIPIGSDGKYRTWRCKIVGEKDLAELGLVEAGES